MAVVLEAHAPQDWRFSYSGSGVGNDSRRVTHGPLEYFFARLPLGVLVDGQIPKSNDIDFDKGWQSELKSSEQLKEVANRWRYQNRNKTDSRGEGQAPQPQRRVFLELPLHRLKAVDSTCD